MNEAGIVLLVSDPISILAVKRGYYVDFMAKQLLGNEQLFSMYFW